MTPDDTHPQVPINPGPRSLSEVEAVKDVRAEARPELVEISREFYSEILGLIPETTGPTAHQDPQTTELRFVGQRHRLILSFLPHPRINTVKRIALITVKSLEQVRHDLDDRRIEYFPSRSLGGAAERLLVADPSGNLLELRQERLL